MTLAQAEPKKIYYGEPIIVSDMQGPCPDGFHVPTKDELDTFKTATSMLTTGIQISSNLKIPVSGYRNNTQGVVENQNSILMFWSSTAKNGNTSYTFMGNSSTVAINGYAKDQGQPIRPFKDSPVTPDSSWTALYSNRVYHNSTLGLISIKNGSSWITIADKNLGATTVYNYGNTLSDANCGYFFQWGNNYGFKFSGTVTTNSTQVDASTYGPGNYYSDSKFRITRGNGWDSSYNYNLWGGTTQGTSTKPREINKVYLGTTQVRPELPPYLCFTANTANSSVKLTKNGSPTAVTLETSTDGSNWSTYTIGNTITLSNIGDKVYWRNTSETDTGFSTSASNYYKFEMTGSIAGSGDATTLLNKNSTTTIGQWCFLHLFNGCTSLTTAPKLLATTLSSYCYKDMFRGCTGLTSIPSLPATTLADNCYQNMFRDCSKIKLSTTQTGEYQTPYRIPTTGTGTEGSDSFYLMFYNTGGTFTSDPTINTTYYTSNTVV